MTLPEQAFILLGSNIEAERNLLLARLRLVELGDVLRTSGVYQSPAIASTPQADYLNAAVLVETRLEPETIRLRLRRIEGDLGRQRSADKYAARTIDLDLCLLGSTILKSREITLPDPELLTRPHVAIPISELDPQFPHPISGESLGSIADRLRPGSALRLRQDLQERFRTG